MKINVFQVAALALFLSGSLVHAMEMGSEQSSKQANKAKNSCLNTCCDVTKKCCYLAAACYVAMRTHEAYKTEPMIFDEAAMSDKPCNYITYKPYGETIQSTQGPWIIHRASREYCSEDGRVWWRRGQEGEKDKNTNSFDQYKDYLI